MRAAAGASNFPIVACRHSNAMSVDGERDEDIAGHEIPAAYHDFVRTGDAWLIRSVLHHNSLDSAIARCCSWRCWPCNNPANKKRL